MLICSDRIAEAYAARLILIDDAKFAGQDLYDMCVASFASPDNTQEEKEATKLFAENVMKFISEHDMIYAEKILEIYMDLLLTSMTEKI
jgi:hypothetical protein